MKALLWKDYRVNGVVLAYALTALVGVYAVLAALNGGVQWRDGVPFKPWSQVLFGAALLSSLLELPAAAALGGCAFAAERADRSAEFLAYLPVSRGKALASKITLAVGALAIIWLVNGGVFLSVAPRLASAGGQDGESAARTLGVFASLSLAMFGVAWLCSSFSSSHALAASVGILAPIACAGGILLTLYLFDLPDSIFETWFPRICAAAGVVCFLSGIRYYLGRVEP